MKTTEKLQIAKEILATSFLQATEKSISSGLQFKYNSYSCDDISFGREIIPIKGWCVDIIVKEAGYGEKTIQQFVYGKPNNIEHKNMEYHVIIDVISNLTQTALISFHEVAKYLSSDKDIQKIIKNGEEDNFVTN